MKPGDLVCLYLPHLALSIPAIIIRWGDLPRTMRVLATIDGRPQTFDSSVSYLSTDLDLIGSDLHLYYDTTKHALRRRGA